MKTQKYILLCHFIGLIGITQECDAQGLGLPTIEVLEARARARNSLVAGGETDAIVYEEGDFQLPVKGMIMKADLKRVAAIHSSISMELTAAPNTAAGKQSERFRRIGAWNAELGKSLASGKQSDFLSLLPALTTHIERDTRLELECIPLQNAEAYMVISGDVFIRALAHHVVHEEGVVAAEVLRQAVVLFGNGRLVDETAWDVDDPMPLDSAGVFILNPELAVEELKKRPVERVRFFLTGTTEASEFFRRYGAEGDGMEKLKSRYAANKAAIDAKHREMVSWLAAR